MGRFFGTADYESLVFGGEETDVGAETDGGGRADSGGETDDGDGKDNGNEADGLVEELFGELPEGIETQELLEELSESDFEPMIVNLELSDGSVMSYEAVGVFIVGETQYMALHPKGEPETGNIPILLLRYVQGEDDELLLQQIEDDEEFEAAEAAFNRMFADGI